MVALNLYQRICFRKRVYNGMFDSVYPPATSPIKINLQPHDKHSLHTQSPNLMLLIIIIHLFNLLRGFQVGFCKFSVNITPTPASFPRAKQPLPNSLSCLRANKQLSYPMASIIILYSHYCKQQHPPLPINNNSANLHRIICTLSLL